MSDVLISVRNLKKHFPISRGLFRRRSAYVKAVDGVDFDIKMGETLGLVGESGCGKTTVARTMLKLIEPTAGKVFFNGKDIFTLGKMELQKIRRDMQMIFQDPFYSLNPRQSVLDIVGAPLEVHDIAKGDEKRKIVQDLLDKVRLDPKEHINRYPHEFSGGQRQRIAIARALALNPKFIIADEPVSGVDVSIRCQILNMMKDLQTDLGLTYMFISHDLSVVRYLCNRIAVMYLGKIVEVADKDLFDNPLHPYTQGLLSAITIPDPTIQRKRIILKGEIPTSINIPKGCRFNPRCPYKERICGEVEPELRLKRGHMVACHLVNEIS